MYVTKPFMFGRPAASIRTPPKARRRSSYERQRLPSLGAIQLEGLRIDQLREALRLNAVSFPSQVPVFDRADRQDRERKVVQLYFILGWSTARIAVRYDLVPQRIAQILNAWTDSAVKMGYIQVIPSTESLRLLAAMPKDYRLYSAADSIPASLQASGFVDRKPQTRFTSSPTS